MDSVFLKSFFPEIFISLFVLFQLLVNVLTLYSVKLNFPVLTKEIVIQTFFALVCVMLLLWNNRIEGFFFNFLFLNDLSTKTAKLLSIVIFLLAFFSIFRSFINQNLNFFEYFIILTISILSMLLLISASDFLSLYLVIEMQSLAFYALACFKRNSAFSTEAGLKYFISGSFMSGIYLLGCSIIYSLVGTLTFNNLNLLLSIPFSDFLAVERNLMVLGMFFIIVFFLFKVSAAPFHFWSPDVYEGSPLCSTIVFSIMPKLAFFYIFFKCVCISFFLTEIKYTLLASGFLSIFIGSFFALKQKRFKRLIIFSSIAQVGFLVTALFNPSYNSLISVYFFIVVYLLTSILIWTHLSLLLTFQKRINVFNDSFEVPIYLSSLSNFFRINRIWSLSYVIIFFSLSGIPPLVGFFSKVLIVYSLIESKNIICSFIIIALSTISVFYYLRVIKVIFFEKKIEQTINRSQIIFCEPFFEYEYLIISFLLFLLVFLFFYPSFLILVSNFMVSNLYFS